MPLLRKRRELSAEQVDLARARVSALAGRRGWVPRVPAAVQPDSVADPDGAPAAPVTGGDGELAVPSTGQGGRHARRVVDPERDGERLAPTVDGWSAVVGEGIPPPETGPNVDIADEPTGGEPSAGHGPVSAAVADRLPLPVRAVVESLPPSIRRGQAGLQPLHAAVVVLIVLLGLAVTALLTGLGRPRVQAVEPVTASTILATGTPVAAAAPGTDGDGAAGDPPAESGQSVIVVHVAGKVAEPGIVQLPPGSRIVDAIEAAGGAEDGVDLTPLNLARVLTDGEQVAVGIDRPPEATDAGSATPSVVSLNSASAEQLATLPGIGPTLAARILQWREQNGRFTAVEELLEVTGIGPAKYEAIAELVTL